MLAGADAGDGLASALAIVPLRAAARHRLVTLERPRLLIVTPGLATLRTHYEDVIVAVVEAGVDVSVRYIGERWLSETDYRETLERRGCAARVSSLPRSRRDRRDLFALRLRQLVNLLRYYHPDYRGREWLRESRFAKAQPGPLKWARRIGSLGSRPALLALRAASSIDRVLPPPPHAREIIAAERPDAVAGVGVLWNPSLVDFLKAAAWRGIPTACWIQSWDNLTNKGLLNFTPDRVFVWNAVQRDELARYHRVPARHVCITGAQTFDHWFEPSHTSSRSEFCSRIGLDPDRPIVLYLSSSPSIEPPPTDFFLRWLDAVRSSGDPVLQQASVLVRPHPAAVEPWLELEGRDAALRVSSSSAAPVGSEEFREHFRDELHHASVAVGLNTSGMIDAAILGNPVCTVELPDVPNHQRGTIHFEYLLSVGGGVVRTATSLDEHVSTLSQLVRKDPYERDEQSVGFVETFIRPHGMPVRSADVFSQEMLRLVGAPSELGLPRALARAAGRVVRQAAPVIGAPLNERQFRRSWERGWRRLQRKRVPGLMKDIL